MTDFIEDLFETQPTQLAPLFEVGKDPEKGSTAELQDALEHLLSLPMDTALNQLPVELAGKLRALATRLRVFRGAEEVRIRRLGDLFLNAKPPLELLRFAKEFGKSVHLHGKTVWPSKVGAVIYYASLGAALVRRGERIGRLSTQDLRTGFGKMAALSWIEPETKKLFEEARTVLSAAPGI